MCLIAFAYQYPFDFHLILFSNRDEFYNRPTLSADLWMEDGRIWGGRDLEGGGSWLGIREDGKFAFLTNYRNLYLKPVHEPRSRGRLVSDFLLSEDNPKEFMDKKKRDANLYEGYNLIVGDKTSLWYGNNRRNEFYALEPGIHVLSNGYLGESWHKTEYLREKFKGFIESGDWLNREKVFAILQNREKSSLENLPDTGIGFEKEWALSSPFIKIPGYGTRSSTYVALKRGDGMANVEALVREERVWV